jgi:hypothetical protein
MVYEKLSVDEMVFYCLFSFLDPIYVTQQGNNTMMVLQHTMTLFH